MNPKEKQIKQLKAEIEQLRNSPFDYSGLIEFKLERLKQLEIKNE